MLSWQQVGLAKRQTTPRENLVLPVVQTIFFPQVIETCHTKQIEVLMENFIWITCTMLIFFERKHSSFKGSISQATHIISDAYLSNYCRFFSSFWVSPLLAGRFDTRQIQVANKKTKSLPRSEPQREADWNVLWETCRAWINWGWTNSPTWLEPFPHFC